MKKRLIWMLSLTCTFLISAVTITYAASAPDPGQMAVHLKNGFYGDSAVVTGDIYSANGNVQFTNSGSNVVTGSIYHRTGTQFTIPEWYKPDFASRVVALPETNYNEAIPDYVNFPQITNYVGQYIPKWDTPNLTITENTHFGNLTVGQNITVDVHDRDIYLVVDQLSCNDGFSIVQSGNGRLYMYIKGYNSSSRPLNVINGNNPDKTFIYSEVSLSHVNLDLYAHVFYEGVSNLQVLGKVTGSIVTDATAVTMSGGTVNIKGLMYAPNAAVILEGSAQINGRLVADSLIQQGMGKISYNSVYSSIPPQALRHEVRVRANISNGGTVSPSSVTVNYGDIIQVTATPKEGYSFTGFSSSDPTMTPDANGNVKVTGPLELTANFELAGEYVHGILGEYFDTSEMNNDSALKMRRIDPSIAFNFMFDSPDPAIDPETFSIRWTGYIKPQVTGDYTFKSLSDDGIRITINGTKVIDRWGALSIDYTIADKPIHLEAGTYYPITFEYQQLPLYAAAFLFWEADGVPMGLVPDSAFYVKQDVKNEYATAKYYNPLDKSGTGLNNTFYTLDESGARAQEYSEVNNIDYVWGEGAPGGIKEDVFYGEMDGYLEAKYSESTTLVFAVDDGIKVWIDGKQVISSWDPHPEGDFKYTFDTVAGQKYKIHIEYADFMLSAACVMRWESNLLGSEAVPKEYLFDN